MQDRNALKLKYVKESIDELDSYLNVKIIELEHNVKFPSNGTMGKGFDETRLEIYKECREKANKLLNHNWIFEKD